MGARSRWAGRQLSAVVAVAVIVSGCGVLDSTQAKGVGVSGRVTELCEALATISALWGVDSLGPEMTEALRTAIASAPPSIAAALQAQSDELWNTPEENQQLVPGEGRAQQNAIDVVAVEQCGVSVFDARITPESPEPIDPSEVPQVDVGANYLPDRQRLSTSAGGVTVWWEMPRINLIDGPRPPRNIAAPANVTYWAYGGVGVDLRYDAMMLTGLGHLGANDDEILRAALTQLNGGAPIEIGVSQRAGGRVEVDFIEQLEERTYIGFAYSWGGNVFSVAVGIPWNREDLMEAARRELVRMDDTVTFEGP